MPEFKSRLPASSLRDPCAGFPTCQRGTVVRIRGAVHVRAEKCRQHSKESADTSIAVITATCRRDQARDRLSK